jgi:hypothetical protein
VSSPTSKELIEYLRHRLENHSNSVTHQPIPLVFGKEATNHTDFIEIPLPENLDREQIEFLFAMEIHESAHTKFTSVTEEDLNNVYEKNGFIDETLFFDIWNQLEDYRINTLITLTHPGAGRLMHKVHARLVSEDPPIEDISQALILELSGFKYEKAFDKEDQKLLDMAVAMSREVISHTAIELVNDFLPNVYTLFSESKTESKKKRPHPTTPLPPGIGSGTTTKKREVSKIDAERKSKEVIEDFSDEISETIEDPKTDETTEDECKEDEECIDEEGEFEIDKILEEAKKIESLSLEKNKLKIKELKKAEGKASEDHPLVHTSPNTSYLSTVDIQKRYSDIVSQFRPQISHLIREMKKMFLFNKGYASGQRSGKLHSRRVHRLVTNGDTKIFRKKNETNAIGDIAILLLVDESGSMCGRNEVHARQAAVVLHEVLREIDIKHMIVGYTADHGTNNNTLHIVYRYWKDKGKTEDLVTIRGRANNRDDETIKTGIRYFDGLPERHKLMIVISDGVPAAHGYSGIKEGTEMTIKAQKEAKQRGIKLVNVGIGEGFKMPEGYINKVKVDDVSQLPQQLINIIKREVK